MSEGVEEGDWEIVLWFVGGCPVLFMFCCVVFSAFRLFVISSGYTEKFVHCGLVGTFEYRCILCRYVEYTIAVVVSHSSNLI